MRWYNKLRLVFRIYSRRMFVTMLLFGMCFVSFFMIDRVFTGYIGSRYAIKQTEKEFGVNTADAGYVHFVTRNIKQDISDKVHAIFFISGLSISGCVVIRSACSSFVS